MFVGFFVLTIVPGSRGVDPTLDALQRTPRFRPILKNPEGFSAEEITLATAIEPKLLVNICTRYQVKALLFLPRGWVVEAHLRWRGAIQLHLRACAEHVAKQQTLVPLRLKHAERKTAGRRRVFK